MTDVVMNPCRKKGEPSLSKTGIICINPGEAVIGCKLAAERGGSRYRLFNSNLFQVPAADTSRPFFVAGPAVGAPMAVLTLEKLGALGAKRIIVYGWCGALAETACTGDVLLPTWALSEEGTSGHYPADRRPEATRALRLALEDYLRDGNIAAISGPVWTTDAPYRETWDKVRAYGRQALLGVDMEFAALCTVAAFRGVDLAAVLLISDELWRRPWQPGFRDKRFRQRSRLVLEILFDFCARFDHE
jgi:uridine phosphorylase